jgi:methionyl-tRNA synthetase
MRSLPEDGQFQRSEWTGEYCPKCGMETIQVTCSGCEHQFEYCEECGWTPEDVETEAKKRLQEQVKRLTEYIAKSCSPACVPGRDILCDGCPIPSIHKE